MNNIYTFDNFITNDSNRFVKDYIINILESEDKFLNTLFLSGGESFGKTHLLYAIKNYPSFNNKVIYLTGSEFIKDTISIDKEDITKLENIYKDVDIFIIDDIDLLKDAPNTLKKFYIIFNYLDKRNKKITISSRYSIDKINIFDISVLNKIKSGLVIEIPKLDLSLKVKIIKEKIHNLNIKLSSDIIKYIAINLDNVREIDGFLTSLSFYMVINNEEKITYLKIKQIMEDYKNE